MSAALDDMLMEGRGRGRGRVAFIDWTRHRDAHDWKDPEEVTIIHSDSVGVHYESMSETPTFAPWHTIDAIYI